MGQKDSGGITFQFARFASYDALADFLLTLLQAILPLTSPAWREKIEQGAKRDAANRRATIHGGVNIVFRDLD